MLNYELCKLFNLENKNTWPIWVTQKGKQIHIHHMGDGHLCNTVRYFHRNIERYRRNVVYFTKEESFKQGESYKIIGKWKIYDIPEKSRPEAIRRICTMPKQKFFETFSIHYPFLIKEAKQRGLYIEGILE